MRSDLYRAAWCYEVATRHLALSPGGLRERLVRAYLVAALAVEMGPKGPPCSNATEERMLMLHAAMTKRPGNREQSTVTVTVREMSDHEVVHAADELIGISEVLQREAMACPDRPRRGATPPGSSWVAALVGDVGPTSPNGEASGRSIVDRGSHDAQTR